MLRLSAVAPQAKKKMVCEKSMGAYFSKSAIILGGVYFEASLANRVGGKLFCSIGKETKLTL